MRQNKELCLCVCFFFAAQDPKRNTTIFFRGPDAENGIAHVSPKRHFAAPAKLQRAKQQEFARANAATELARANAATELARAAKQLERGTRKQLAKATRKRLAKATRNQLAWSGQQAPAKISAPKWCKW